MNGTKGQVRVCDMKGSGLIQWRRKGLTWIERNGFGTCYVFELLKTQYEGIISHGTHFHGSVISREYFSRGLVNF